MSWWIDHAHWPTRNKEFIQCSFEKFIVVYLLTYQYSYPKLIQTATTNHLVKIIERPKAWLLLEGRAKNGQNSHHISIKWLLKSKTFHETTINKSWGSKEKLWQNMWLCLSSCSRSQCLSFDHEYKNIVSVSIWTLATQMVDLRATFAAIPTTSPEGLGASQWIPGKNGSIVCWSVQVRT